MRPSIRNTFIAGLLLLVGTPVVATLLAITQAVKGGPDSSSGHSISTIVVANIACFPFMFIGLILLLVAWVMHRRALHRTGA